MKITNDFDLESYLTKLPYQTALDVIDFDALAELPNSGGSILCMEVLVDYMAGNKNKAVSIYNADHPQFQEEAIVAFRDVIQDEDYLKELISSLESFNDMHNDEEND